MSRERDIARAKQELADELLQQTQQLQCCTCAFPLERLRNRHGHREDCPAVVVWKAWEER